MARFQENLSVSRPFLYAQLRLDIELTVIDAFQRGVGKISFVHFGYASLYHFGFMEFSLARYRFQFMGLNKRRNFHLFNGLLMMSL
jgi:hypothetical protein